MNLAHRLSLFFLLYLLASAPCQLAAAEASTDEDPFPLLPGLEQAVEFWKLVFTRYSTSEVIFHDPQEPAKIYKVVEMEEGLE